MKCRKSRRNNISTREVTNNLFREPVNGRIEKNLRKSIKDLKFYFVACTWVRSDSIVSEEDWWTTFQFAQKRRERQEFFRADFHFLL